MPTSVTATPQAADATRSPAVRRVGRFQLLRLAGRSERTMAWHVSDDKSGKDLLLVLPRVQPTHAEATDRWKLAATMASRLKHPNLAAPFEIGAQEAWPYVAYELGESVTLTDRWTAKGLPGTDMATLMIQVLNGLAFAHEGGAAHHDLQPYLLLLDEQGNVQVAGLEVAANHDAAPNETGSANLQQQRGAAERDVLTAGLILHQGLVGQPALDEPDTGRAANRLPPQGREIVRLPWSAPRPVAEALRAIVNRATDRQERQRYRSARTLARALEGWLQTEASQGGGPLALLSSRLHTVGVLPASPGAAGRARRLVEMERERTNELAEVVLQDLALAFDLLRAVNTAQARSAQAAGSSPVLTIRRAIAMVGLEGVRRAALALRPWPGPLDDGAASELEALFGRVQRAGRLAQSLRPAGYDGEVVYLVALLQNLGRLVVQYHFPDEASQIRRLMMPQPAAQAGEPAEPGMTEETASFAVLGADLESMGSAVARHFGLDNTVIHMIRRLPVATPVRSLDSDDDTLRAIASCANEVVDALALTAAQIGPALQRVVQRYGRALNLSARDVQAAIANKALLRGDDDEHGETIGAAR